MSESANDAAFEELVKEHGNCARLDLDGKLYAFRTPTLEEWEEYQDRINNPKRPKGASFRELIQTTCVTSLEDTQALLKRRPAVAQPIAAAVCELAGIDVEVTVKKD